MPEIVTKTPKAFGYTNVNRTKPHSVPTKRWRTVSHTSSGRHRDVDRIRAYADLAITGRAASNASSSGAVLGQDIDKPEVMVSGSGLRSKLNSKTVKQKPNGYKYTRGKTATTQVRASPVTVSVVSTRRLSYSSSRRAVTIGRTTRSIAYRKQVSKSYNMTSSHSRKIPQNKLGMHTKRLSTESQDTLAFRNSATIHATMAPAGFSQEHSRYVTSAEWVLNETVSNAVELVNVSSILPTSAKVMWRPTGATITNQISSSNHRMVERRLDNRLASDGEFRENKRTSRNKRYSTRPEERNTPVSDRYQTQKSNPASSAPSIRDKTDMLFEEPRHVSSPSSLQIPEHTFIAESKKLYDLNSTATDTANSTIDGSKDNTTNPYRQFTPQRANFSTLQETPTAAYSNQDHSSKGSSNDILTEVIPDESSTRRVFALTRKQMSGSGYSALPHFRYNDHQIKKLLKVQSLRGNQNKAPATPRQLATRASQRTSRKTTRTGVANFSPSSHFSFDNDQYNASSRDPEVKATSSTGNEEDISRRSVRPRLSSVMTRQPLRGNSLGEYYYDDLNETVSDIIFNDILQNRTPENEDEARPSTKRQNILRTDYYYDDGTSPEIVRNPVFDDGSNELYDNVPELDSSQDIFL